MLLIKLSSIKNEENVITYSNHLIKKNIKYTNSTSFSSIVLTIRMRSKGLPE